MVHTAVGQGRFQESQRLLTAMSPHWRTETRIAISYGAAGRTNRQTGEHLFISDKTVSLHLSRVMAKLGVRTRAEAVAIAYDRGLLANGVAVGGAS